MISIDLNLKEELEGLKKRNLLNPKDMFEYAKENPDSVLYSKLEWDKSKAHYEYNLWICREIISSFKWEYVTQEKEVIETRRWISLEQDRHDKGGYREITDILNNKELRLKLLTNAKQDFAIWKSRYIVLEEELKFVFKAMDKLN
jgi:hypothetical protein